MTNQFIQFLKLTKHYNCPRSPENGNYDAMYAVVLTVAFIGFLADRIYQVFQDRMLRWQQ